MGIAEEEENWPNFDMDVLNNSPFLCWSPKLPPTQCMNQQFQTSFSKVKEMKNSASCWTITWTGERSFYDTHHRRPTIWTGKAEQKTFWHMLTSICSFLWKASFMAESPHYLQSMKFYNAQSPVNFLPGDWTSRFHTCKSTIGSATINDKRSRNHYRWSQNKAVKITDSPIEDLT